MTDQYALWRKLLAIGDGRQLTREQLEGANVPEEPQSGFWRRRAYKDGPYEPVAIWTADGKVWCLQAGKEKVAGEIWTYCVWWPIPEAQYHAVMDGQPWPDEPPSITKEHNLPAKTGDPYKDLQAEFEAERELAEGFLKKPITTQQQADQAAVWSKRVAAIAKKATDLHKVEKQPSLDEGRRVDDKWRDLKDQPTELAKKLKRHMDAFLLEQDRLEQERQRKARLEADRIRREAEEAAARAAAASRAAEAEKARLAEAEPGIVSSFAAGVDDQADRLEQQRKDALAEAERLALQVAAADREAEARNANAGRTGARVSLHTFFIGRITDYAAAVMALKDEPDVREAVEKIVNRLARTKGATMPNGTERVEDRKAA